MPLNPVSAGCAVSAGDAVIAAAVAMRRRPASSSGRSTPVLPAFGVGSAVAVAYWISVMHGLFGVGEVAGGWPGRVAGNAAVVVGATDATLLWRQRMSRRTGIRIHGRMAAPLLRVNDPIGTTMPCLGSASDPVLLGWPGP